MEPSSNQSIPTTDTYLIKHTLQRRFFPHLFGALATIILIGSILALVALQKHDLGPLDILAKVTKPGAITILVASTIGTGGYLIWVHYGKSDNLVTLTNGKSTMRFFRPGKSKALRNLMARFGSYDQHSDPLTKKTEMFNDIKHPIKLVKNKEDYSHLWKAAEEQGLLKELYFEVVSHPSSYFLYEQSLGFGSYKSGAKVEPFGFKECGCDNTAAFNRLLPAKGNRRKGFEKGIVKHVLKTQPNRNEVVRFIDLGCGDLLEPWMIIGLLMKEGYKKFDVTLVDPLLTNGRVKKFRDFFKKFDDIELNCVCVNRIAYDSEKKIVKLDLYEETANLAGGVYPDPKKIEDSWDLPDFEVHFISAIDYDDYDRKDGEAKQAVEASQKALAEGGKLFLGYSTTDYFLGKTDQLPESKNLS